MNKTTLRYGAYGAIVMAVVFIPEYFIFRNNPNWELQEVIGYATIVVSLVFVYFGIRKWRDKENAGQLRFWRGIGLGSLISLLPAIAFGLFALLENSLAPEYMDKYYAHYIEKIKQSTPPDQLEAAIKNFNTEKEMFSSPVAQFFIPFLTVFIIGFIATIISTLILRRNKAAVAR